MIPLAVRDAADRPAGPTSRRKRFGLDAPLPADSAVVIRAVLRHLAEQRPAVLTLGLGRCNPAGPLARPDAVRLAAGVPDLLLLAPGGRLVFLAVRTQPQAETRAERAFADLCRERGIAVHAVRSLPEARRLFDRLGFPHHPEAGPCPANP